MGVWTGNTKTCTLGHAITASPAIPAGTCVDEKPGRCGACPEDHRCGCRTSCKRDADVWKVCGNTCSLALARLEQLFARRRSLATLTGGETCRYVTRYWLVWSVRCAWLCPRLRPPRPGPRTTRRLASGTTAPTGHLVSASSPWILAIFASSPESRRPSDASERLRRPHRSSSCAASRSVRCGGCPPVRWVWNRWTGVRSIVRAGYRDLASAKRCPPPVQRYLQTVGADHPRTEPAGPSPGLEGQCCRHSECTRGFKLE